MSLRGAHETRPVAWDMTRPHRPAGALSSQVSASSAASGPVLPNSSARCARSRSGAPPITAFDTAGFAHTHACGVPDFAPEQWISRLDPGEMGRATQLSIASTVLALRDAHLTPRRLRDQRVLIAVGTGYGESGELDRIVAQQVASGTKDVDGSTAVRSASSRLSADVARQLELTEAEAVTIPTACAAGNYAIGYGFDAVAGGEADVSLCGGADALLRMTFVTFYRLGTMAPRMCQPFDRNRKGILTGEGGAMLVLEDLDSATARGAHIYAEVLGYGLACDARHPVAPDQQGIARCISQAHMNAGIAPGQVDYIFGARDQHQGQRRAFDRGGNDPQGLRREGAAGQLPQVDAGPRDGGGGRARRGRMRHRAGRRVHPADHFNTTPQADLGDRPRLRHQRSAVSGAAGGPEQLAGFRFYNITWCCSWAASTKTAHDAPPGGSTGHHRVGGLFPAGTWRASAWPRACAGGRPLRARGTGGARFRCPRDPRPDRHAVDGPCRRPGRRDDSQAAGTSRHRQGRRLLAIAPLVGDPPLAREPACRR